MTVFFICPGLSFSEEEDDSLPPPVDLSSSTLNIPVLPSGTEEKEPSGKPLELSGNDINKFIPPRQPELKETEKKEKKQKPRKKKKNKKKDSDNIIEYKNREEDEYIVISQEFNRPSMQDNFMPDSLPAQSAQRIVTYKLKPKAETECAKCQETYVMKNRPSLPSFAPKGIPAPGEKREQPKLLFRTSLPIYLPGKLPGPGEKPKPGERPKPGQGLVPGERLKPGTAPGPGGERPKPGPRPGPRGFGPSVSLPQTGGCK